jgi:hypothetical protein
MVLSLFNAIVSRPNWLYPFTDAPRIARDHGSTAALHAVSVYGHGDDLNQTFCRMRQNGIDEELFELIERYEAMQKAT